MPANTGKRATTDGVGGGDLSVPVVNPNAEREIVYVASTVAWKSVEEGRPGPAGAALPGGDDYQRLWINPNHADTILAVSDQGA